jgi:diguanylate cyclase (GGDEF)-like protein
MGPFLTSVGITATHFFVLALLWHVTDRFFSISPWVLLGFYLLGGPIPYLYHAYTRQKGWNAATQSYTYLLGFANLLLTLGFVYQCRMEVVKISIPLVVNDPPWMTALLIGYVGMSGLLSYRMVRVSDHPFLKTPPRALLPPALKIPFLKQNLPPAYQPPEPENSIISISSVDRPLPQKEKIPPMEPEPAGPKTRLTTTADGFINEQLYPPPVRRQKGLMPLESMETSRIKQIQDRFSALTGLTLITYDAQGVPVCEPSLENPVCLVVQKTPKGQEHCKAHCGKSIGRALQGREPVFFKCNIGLHVFSIPAIFQDKEEKTNMVFLGGKTFYAPDEFSACRQGSKDLGVPAEEIAALSDIFRVVDNHTVVSAARFLESVLPFLLTTLYEKELTTAKMARLRTLLTLASDFREKRSVKALASHLLNTLGILFDLHTASVMVQDTPEEHFKVEAAFGQKAHLIASCSTESGTGLLRTLQEKAGAVSSQNTFEILKTGLPAQIASVHLFPLLVRSGRITGILAVFDTPLTEEEVSIIQAFCQQVAVCQENTDLRAERHELAEDVSLLIDIARTVGSTLDSEDLFGIILDKATEFLQAEQGSLMLLDEERRELTIKAMKGLNKKIVELLKIRPGEGISGKVLATGAPLVVSDIESDDRVGQERRPRYKTKSFISMPLKLNGRTIGVINIADKITGEIFKEEDLRLLTSIAAYASVAIERSKFYHKTEELKKISITDSLTGLLNRRYFQERISEEVERSRRHHLPLSLIMIDIDNFKAVNDTYGHLVGDETLKIMARTLRNCIRTIDVAARYGGEEFTVILPQTTKSDAVVIAERICKEIGRLDFPFEQVVPRLTVSVSLGLATFPEDADSLDELIRNTDIALYQAKAEGKNRVVVFEKSGGGGPRLGYPAPPAQA